jgi:voltage-gated potassium channel
MFLAVIVSGTAGYRAIEGWSWLDAIWMVGITLTTIGYGEVHPLSDAGRWFTLALIVCGLSTASYAVANLTSFVVDGELRARLQAHRERQRMEALQDHYIVAGFGRTGREIVADLLHAGERVVVIDPDEAARDGCEALEVQFLRADASDDHTLRQAGVTRARGLAVATSQDAVNVFVTLTAHHLNPKLKIITQVDRPESSEKARRAGASGVVNPHALGGTTIANALLRPHSATFMENAFARSHPDLAMEDVPVGPASRLRGRLKTLNLRERFEVLPVAVRRADGALVPIPGPDTEIREGDVLVLIGRPERLRQLRTGKRDHNEDP